MSDSSTEGDLAVQQACARLTAAFTFMVDHRRYDELVQLFTEDCVFDRPGALLQGRDELRAFMEARSTTVISRHFCAPTVILEVEGDRAKGLTYLAFFDAGASDGGPAVLRGVQALAEYHDEFRRTSAGWLIAKRKVVPIMVQP